MNERDVAEALLRKYGEHRAYYYVDSFAERLGLNPERIFTLLELAKVQVTWDE
ncbi:hypothetical protein AB0J80_36170 [Actinoplanes sp. NPDC049548]|uniref:hypothetical protein n=1 Tax=Actinoplanes sp. NPDC049548 TaxID=3155152 RepID=UPI00341E762D